MPDTPLNYLEKKLLCKKGNATAIFRSHGKPATFSKSRFRDYDGTIAEQVEGSIGGRSSVLGWWLPKEQSFVVRCPHGVLPLWAFGFLEASACGYALLEEEADEKMDEKFPSLAALQEARPDIEAKLSTPDAAGEARDVALREILCLRQREPRFSNGTTDDIDLALCSMSRSVRASLVARIAGNDEALVRHGRRLMVAKGKEKVLAFPTRRERALIRLRGLALSGLFDDGVFRAILYDSSSKTPYCASVHASALRNLGDGFLDGRRVLPDDRPPSTDGIRPEYILQIAGKSGIVYRAQIRI